MLNLMGSCWWLYYFIS